MDYFIRIKVAPDWIEGRLTEEGRPADVAEMACFSRSHFPTVFRAVVGMPLAAYIRKRRLCHAARDLLESGDTILDIAMRYGFASHEAFIRAFRRELGYAPSAFRKAGKAMDSAVIVPGIFGPMPPRKESILDSMKRTEKGPGFAILHGVPEVSYFNDRHEVTPFPSSLRSCLMYMGVDIPYAHLLDASGAAFRLMWNTAIWDGGDGSSIGRRSRSLPLGRKQRAPIPRISQRIRSALRRKLWLPIGSATTRADRTRLRHGPRPSPGRKSSCRARLSTSSWNGRCA